MRLCPSARTPLSLLPLTTLLVLTACGVSAAPGEATSQQPDADRARPAAPAAALAPSYFRRGRGLVRATPTEDGYSLVLEDGDSLAPLPGEIARHGRVRLIDARRAPPRAALEQEGAILPTYTVEGSRRVRYATPYLYVKLASGTSPRALDAWLRRNGLELEARLHVPEWVYVRAHENPIDKARALVESGEATESEPSFFVSTTLYGIAPLAPNDPYFPDQWNLHNGGPFTTQDGKGIITGADHPHIAQAWQLLVRLGRASGAAEIGQTVRLGIIDDGFDLRHEDLAGKFIATHNFGGAVEPGTLFDNTVNKNFHGTLVTGIAAATADNGLGIAGACPGCKLIAARMAASTPTGMTPDQYYDQIFDWVMAQDPDIINCSWGPDDTVATSYYNALVQRITTTGRGGKGTVLVFASGNSGEDFGWNALASHPRSITVGASDSTGKRYSFSNFGAGLDVLASTSGGERASGVTPRYTDRIWTTDNFIAPTCLPAGGQPSSGCSDHAGWTPNGNMAGGDGWWGKYSYRFSHTSSAAPLVSGVIGVMLQANPSLTVDDVNAILHETADRVSPAEAGYDASGFSTTYGYGRINALRAVARAYELGGGTLSDATKGDIDQSSPCTRPSCWGDPTGGSGGAGTGSASSGSGGSGTASAGSGTASAGSGGAGSGTASAGSGGAGGAMAGAGGAGGSGGTRGSSGSTGASGGSVPGGAGSGGATGAGTPGGTTVATSGSGGGQPHEEGGCAASPAPSQEQTLAWPVLLGLPLLLRRRRQRG